MRSNVEQESFDSSAWRRSRILSRAPTPQNLEDKEKICFLLGPRKSHWAFDTRNVHLLDGLKLKSNVTIFTVFYSFQQLWNWLFHLGLQHWQLQQRRRSEEVQTGRSERSGWGRWICPGKEFNRLQRLDFFGCFWNDSWSCSTFNNAHRGFVLCMVVRIES